MTGACRRCQATVVWGRTPDGQRVAVDAGRTRDGNVQLVHLRVYDEPEVRVLRGRALKALRAYHAAAVAQGIDTEPELLLHRLHQQTCPDMAARGVAA